MFGLLPILALALGVSSSPLVKCAVTGQVYEAEDGLLSGPTVLTDLAGFSGSGYVGSFTSSEHKVTFAVESTNTTLYDVKVRYAGIYGQKTASLIINGGARSDVLLPATETWAEVSAGQLLLDAGSNSIDIVANWGWYLIDSITLTPSEARPAHNISPSLVNEEADASAVKLYDFLRGIYGKKILSGQQELSWADWITTQTGKTPALISVDLMDYSPSRVERGTVGTSVEEAISFAGRGGIVSVLWHWNAPSGLHDTEENKWWSGFYTRATSFDIAATLANPNGSDYALILRDIDAIAAQLKRLQNAGIPILFRPLHEAEGAWFWWGAKGPEACIKLWELLYDRLTEFHGINNLIWIWNSVAEDWYPGPETVDIVSADVYATGNGPMSAQYNQLFALGQDEKLIAATEVGAAPLPDLLVAYEAHWLWFCVWGGSFIDNPQYNSPEVLQEIYDSEYVLTLDEIQGWNT